MLHPNIIEQSKALEFITAGKALFTIRSIKTGKRFTYKVRVPKDQSKEDPNIMFVSVLTGCNNDSDYTYIGFIRKDNQGKWMYYYGKASRISIEAESVIAINWIINELLTKNLTTKNLELWHEGRCCRCGRTLTDPESIESGIGPECSSIKTKHRYEASHA